MNATSDTTAGKKLNSDDKSRRVFAKRLLALTLSIGFSLAVGEVALRVAGYSPQYFNHRSSFQEYDEVVGRRGKPNFAGRFRTLNFDVVVVQDENGFRQQEYMQCVAKSGSRAYAFGDSFTWGWGVEQGEVFTDVMSQQLTDYEVMNFGVAGTGTVQQYTIFEQYVKDRLQPGETVLLTFCGNDFTDNIDESLRGEVRDGRVEIVQPEPRRSKSAMKRWLKQHSYLFNLAAFQVDRMKQERRQRRGAQRVADQQKIGIGRKERDIPADSPEVIVTSHFLKQFRNDCRDRGAKFVVVAIADDPVLKDVVDRLDIDLIELVPHFLAELNSGRIQRHTIANDGHWNADGHRIAGNVLAEYLRHR